MEEPGPSEQPAPVDPEGAELERRREELERRIKAGASNREELRALAEQLRAQRAEEDAYWRRTVKPGLKRSGVDSPRSRRNLGLAILAVVGVAIVILAAVVAGPVVLVVAVAAVVAGAYLLGRREQPDGSGSGSGSGAQGSRP